MSQIAQTAGVSMMTLARVLRDTDGYLKATREKVLREVKLLKQANVPVVGRLFKKKN